MKIKELLCALEQFAPLPLQESFDNAGLQIGLTEAEVSGALLCLDVTEGVIDEAVKKGCNLIVAHHPLIFHKLAHITGDNYVERCVMKAIRHDITIVAMHTNMDNASGGVNFKIAEKLGLQDVRFMASTLRYMQVDSTPADKDAESAGAAQQPIPYGSGVIGILPEPVMAGELMQRLKDTFHVACVQCNELLQRPIRRVALCGGAGAFLLPNAIAEKADAFITGEMHYHEYFGHEQEIQIAVIGHYQSEQFTSEVFRDIILKAAPQVACHIAMTNTNPIIYR